MKKNNPIQLSLFIMFMAAMISNCGGYAPDSIPDSKIGLAKSGIRDVSEPITFKYYNEKYKMPQKKNPYQGFPNVIKHNISQYLPIKAEENQCLGCHEIKAEKTAGSPTPIPKSHLIDYRNTPGRVGKKLYGARYNCISCHVAQSDAKALVKMR